MGSDVTNPIYKVKTDRPRVKVRVPQDVLNQLLNTAENDVQDIQRHFFNIGSWVATCSDYGPRLWSITPPEGMELPKELQGSFTGRETCRAVLTRYLLEHPEQKEVFESE